MLFMRLVVLSDDNSSDESLARLSKVLSLAQDLRCAIAEGCQNLVRCSCEVPQLGYFAQLRKPATGSAKNLRRNRYTVVQCTPRRCAARTACSRDSGPRPNGRSTDATFSTRLLLSFVSVTAAPCRPSSKGISRIKGHGERASKINGHHVAPLLPKRNRWQNS